MFCYFYILLKYKGDSPSSNSNLFFVSFVLYWLLILDLVFIYLQINHLPSDIIGTLLQYLYKYGKFEHAL